MRAHRRQTGFTIIEVMIVLMIASIFLLMVFLAVPSVQRRSRNNERKSDVVLIRADLESYTLEHGGTPPTVNCSGYPTNPMCDTIFLQRKNYSYYLLENIGYRYRSNIDTDGFPDYEGPAPVGATEPQENRLTWMLAMNYYQCTVDSHGEQIATHAGATAKHTVVLYDLETATPGVANHYCLDI